MSKLQEAIKSLESIQCQDCGGNGCHSCGDSGFMRDPDELVNQMLESQLENISLTLKHYLDMNSPRHTLSSLLLKINSRDKIK